MDSSSFLGTPRIIFILLIFSSSPSCIDNKFTGEKRCFPEQIPRNN
jgi:hypothetical protein